MRGRRPRVDFIELFFDLVFVFAVTQLSHYVLHHMTFGGVVQATLLLCAVWWVWVYTAWCTNWLDPHRMPVRGLIFLLMLGGIVLAASIPDAFGARGASFAGAYVFMQVGRTGFMLWALRLHRPANFRNFTRIIIWLFASSVFWVAGGLTIGLEQRFMLWLVAIVIEYVSPALGFRVPGMGASATADWDVAGAHLAERCSLFVIIALGESVLVSGATFADLAWTSESVTAFLAAFVGIVAMWWIYFNVGADHASRKISGSPDPGRIARVAYTYLPIVLVAGIIVVAVGDEIMLTLPFEQEDSLAGAAGDHRRRGALRSRQWPLQGLRLRALAVVASRRARPARGHLAGRPRSRASAARHGGLGHSRPRRRVGVRLASPFARTSVKAVATGPRKTAAAVAISPRLGFGFG